MKAIEQNDVIVLIPGLFGSALTHDGREVWAPSLRRSPETTLADLRMISTVVDMGEEVSATRLIAAPLVIPGVWRTDDYQRILTYLKRRWPLRVVTFPYDWRKDHRLAAYQLEERSREWLSEAREKAGQWPNEEDPRLVLIGVSTGGLVAQYFLSQLGGERVTRSFVTIGTPFTGSVGVLAALSGEPTVRLPRLDDAVESIRNMTSLHQLLPTHQVIRAGRDDRLRHLGDALSAFPGIEPAWLYDAEQFQSELQPEDRRLDPIAHLHISGINQPTVTAAQVDGTDGVVFEVSPRGGDGVTPSEAQRRGPRSWPLEITERHGSLQNRDEVHRAIHRYLLAGRTATGSTAETTASGFGLDLDDLYPSDQPIYVRIADHRSYSRPYEVHTDRVDGAATDRQIHRKASDAGVELGFMEPGHYRLTVSGSPSVTEQFLVLDQSESFVKSRQYRLIPDDDHVARKSLSLHDPQLKVEVAASPPPSSQPLAPAGWYRDPGGSPSQRYFDGAVWTNHYHYDTAPPAAAAGNLPFITDASTKPVTNSALVEVWYGTNREARSRPRGRLSHANRRDPLNSLRCGVATVEVPAATLRRKGTLGTPWFKRWARLEFRRDKLTLASVRLNATPAEFFDEVRSVVKERKISSALLYIHGYNVSFHDCVLRSAQLAVDLEHDGIAAAFTWPSRAKVRSYIKDKTAVEQSEQPLAEFINGLATRTGLGAVHIIAHSMGNAGLIRAMGQVAPVLRNAGIQLGQVILAAPDVDAVTFKSLATVYPEISARTTMYASDRDRALRVSRWIQDDRAGFVPPVTTVDGIDTVHVSHLDVTSMFDLGHGVYAQSKELLADINSLLTRGDEPARRFGIRASQDPTGQAFWKFRP